MNGSDQCYLPSNVIIKMRDLLKKLKDLLVEADKNAAEWQKITGK